MGAQTALSSHKEEEKETERKREEEKKDEYLFHVLVQKAFLSKEKL